jgi:hypothetical protein
MPKRLCKDVTDALLATHTSNTVCSADECTDAGNLASDCTAQPTLLLRPSLLIGRTDTAREYFALSLGVATSCLSPSMR